MLGYKRFASTLGNRGLTPETMVSAYEKVCAVRPDLVLPQKISDDPNDNIVLGCALAHQAHYVITGDRHLLKLKQFADIRIINAKQFLSDFKKSS